MFFRYRSSSCIQLSLYVAMIAVDVGARARADIQEEHGKHFVLMQHP